MVIYVNAMMLITRASHEATAQIEITREELIL